MSDRKDEPLIPEHGGYRNLKSFQVAQLVYDVTVRFCERYIDKRSRTTDQMIQAARSGVQNIAEGSQASGTSKKFEIKLTSVARASLEELKLDYEDFLRHRGLKQWARDHPLRQSLVDHRCTAVEEVAEWIEAMHGQGGRNGSNGHSHSKDESTSKGSSTSSSRSTPTTYPELAANAALTLITVACFLLDRQMASQAGSFENEGGFTERLYRIRSKRKARVR